jgi:hypothetical protein
VFRLATSCFDSLEILAQNNVHEPGHGTCAVTPSKTVVVFLHRENPKCAKAKCRRTLNTGENSSHCWCTYISSTRESIQQDVAFSGNDNVL